MSPSAEDEALDMPPHMDKRAYTALSPSPSALLVSMGPAVRGESVHILYPFHILETKLVGALSVVVAYCAGLIDATVSRKNAVRQTPFASETPRRVKIQSQSLPSLRDALTVSSHCCSQSWSIPPHLQSCAKPWLMGMYTNAQMNKNRHAHIHAPT